MIPDGVQSVDFVNQKEAAQIGAAKGVDRQNIVIDMAASKKNKQVERHD